jgi:CHAT domain-containing protein
VNDAIVVSTSTIGTLLVNLAERAVSAIRAFALALASVVLATLPGHKLPSSQRSGSAHQKLEVLRHRTHDLFATGRYSEAADLFESAYRQAIAQNRPEYAIRFLNGLGSSRFALFEYQRAIGGLVRALELARSWGDPVWISTVSSNLCSLYMQAGDMVSAKHAADEGLRVPADTNLTYRSQFLAVLGLLESNSGNGAKALKYFREAVESAEMHGADRLRFDAWNHYAQQLLLAGDLDGAETAALNVYRLGGLAGVREMRPAYLSLARIKRVRGNPGLALSLIDRGLAIPPRKGDRQLWRMYFLYERAMVRISNRQLAAAESDLRQALSYAGQWREALAPSDSLRSGAEFWLKGLYDAYIDVTTRQGAASAAFLAVEEERSASLLGMLLESPRGRRRTDQYWQDLARLRAVEIAQITDPSPGNRYQTAQIRQRLSEAEARTGMEFVPPAERKSESFLSRETLLTIERAIAPGEAVISFHLGASVSYVWALTNHRLEMHPIAAGRKLAGLAERFRRSVQDGSVERDGLGADLYLELFGKLSAPVLGKTAWLVASDDSLFDVPFAALVVGRKNGRPVYLVERHRTNRIPSAFSMTRQPSAVAGLDLPRRFLGIGDGVYNTADKRWKAIQATPPLFGFLQLFNAPGKPKIELPRLVSSPFELWSCAAAWNPLRRAVLLTGRNASRERLWAALEAKPAIVHFAAHILYPEGKPDQALIHLGLRPSGEPDVLTNKDVTSLPAGGALVVLSGCSSAAGNSVRGAGVMGLPRAWLLAGARGVVGSRWPVPDDTGELFRSFYAHLAMARLSRSGLSSALQQARLEMLRSNTWRSDPRYWGAFYLLTGE